MKKLRVIQWTTGKVGKLALRGVLDDPRLVLAGVYAYSDDKAGQDAGTLCGRPACGVTATSDIAALIALGADSVLYTPFMADLDHVVRLLESGLDVVSTNLFANLGGVRGEVAEALEAACERGNSSLYITGVNPGWVNNLAATMTAVCRDVQSVSIAESANCATYESPETWQSLGFSLPETTPEVIERAKGALLSFRDAVERLAEALEYRLDETEFFIEHATAATRTDLGWFVMEQGTNAAIRGGWNGKVGGRTVVQIRVAWYLTKDLAEGWEFDDDHYEILVEGEPGVRAKLRFIPPESWGNHEWDTMTAMPAVNVLGTVKAARPGILSLADVGLAVAPAGLWGVNFEWTADEAAFRQRLKHFLAVTLPDEWERFSQHGPASPALTAYAREFCGKLAAQDLLTPHWPKEIGGLGLDPWHQTILAEEMWVAGEPRGGQYMNVNWVGPTLIKYGSRAQQERYLPAITGGTALWCQGFSEPGSGSDLASLRTRAERVDDEYRVNGQKIWTSYAGLAQTCFLLCRTGEDRKKGISILLVPMDTPGIAVRAIPSLIGEGDIHEVFFDDVRVPATALFGEEGQAWEIIAYSLVNERLGIPRYSLARAALDRAVAVLKEKGGWSGEAVRIEAAHAAALCEAARTASYAIVTKRAHGEAVGAESSSARFATVSAERRVAEFVVEYLPEALADAHPYLKMHHQRGIVAGIAAGAAEIQLNIIANDVLKLPREPR